MLLIAQVVLARPNLPVVVTTFVGAVVTADFASWEVLIALVCISNMDKGDKFLKKLWCCVGRRV